MRGMCKGSAFLRWSVIGWMAAAVLWTGAGCARQRSEAQEEKHPLIRKAQAAREAGEPDRAIEYGERALRKNPDLSVAHRELALLLDHYRQDYPGALVHYRRYLQLRPESPQREAMEEMMHHCEMTFAAQLVDAPDRLKKELADKELRIRELELEVVQLRESAANAGGPAIVVPAKVAQAARKDAVKKEAAARRTHTVQPGETLATISKQVYGTTARWKDIFQANRGQIEDANRVRVGTTLEIPE